MDEEREMTIDADRIDEHGAEHIGSFAAEHLSPTYPQRAPWGTAQRLRHCRL